MPQQRLPRFEQHPDKVDLGQISERCLDIIATIENYGVISTSLLEILVGGNTRHTQELLQKLFHHDYLKRFSLGVFGLSRNEIFCYLDNRMALQLLIERRKVKREKLNWSRLSQNKRRPYMDIHSKDRLKRIAALGRFTFINHQITISRFHGMVQRYCQQSGGRVKLKRWLQGPHKNVKVSAARYNRTDRDWELDDGSRWLPWKPDAFFVLSFHNAAGGEGLELGFPYEAQHTTETARIDLLDKYQAHYEFVRQKKHQEYFGISRIRAVLTEAPNKEKAEYLLQLTKHPVVLGNRNPSSLFWFTVSKFFTEVHDIEQGRSKPAQLPRWLFRPETVAESIWVTPVDDAPLSLFHNDGYPVDSGSPKM